MLDEKYMRIAIEEAKKGEGGTNPNPLVGSVIVKNRKILSRGYHKKYGENHAEVEAIKKCNLKDLDGATLYVTLEPCSHYGKTPPCVELIKKSKIKRCVIGIKDPNPLVAGRGIEILKKAGIEVVVSILEKECFELNRVFFKYITTKYPFIFLKCAITLDGKIATRDYSSKWITNSIARKKVQLYRNKYSSILIGVNTANRDNPSLKSNLKRNPIRIILDRNFNIDENLNLIVENNDTKTIIVIDEKWKNSLKYNRLKKYNINFIEIKANETLKDILKKIGELKIDSILVEGGGDIISQFFKDNLIDGGEIMISPKILGDNKSIPFISGFNFKTIDQAFELKNLKFNIYDNNIGVEFYKESLCLQD